MSSSVDILKERIIGKKKSYDYREVWHYLMCQYGWIPLGEFLELSCEDTDYLVEQINKLNNMKRKKIKHGSRRN
jgi:hypothetical protein